ncbi:aspartate/glutamate racemase family protein [Salinimonas sediminis]|uniref:Hydrogenase expression protein HupH n=1 Tax=Salinimonas sediminis TaxID=2303538 RepID=A0A346NKA3_9ALTE|nr:aspartate/glutamate racemase family protein [Salinimonas sediminis]AXR05960.1 hydrogenase expression protein HupH [Salinimonas sediminis]
MGYKIKVIIPIPVDDAGVQARAAQLPPGLLSDDCTVEFEAVKAGAALGDSYHDTLLMDVSVVEAGLLAEKQGFDAVCIDTVSDSGMAALRSCLTIPVVAPGISSMLMACNLGKKFSIITMWDEWFALYDKVLTEHHLWDHLASMRSINTRPDLAELLAGKEEVVFNKLLKEAELAISHDKADVIILGSTTMHQSHAFLAQRLSVPVLNPGQIAFKTCQTLLELGLSHSKKAYPAPELPRFDVYHRIGKSA